MISKGRTSGSIRKTKLEVHAYYVFNHPEWIEAATLLWKRFRTEKTDVNSQRELTEKLANEYCIPYDFVSKAWIEGPNSELSPNYLGSVVDTENKEIALRFNASVTYEEYINAWKDVARHLRLHGLGRKTKRKLPEDSDLVFAIFMARKHGESFKKIFDLYQKGLLPDYIDKPRNQFASEDALERYYNTHKPVV